MDIYIGQATTTTGKHATSAMAPQTTIPSTKNTVTPANTLPLTKATTGPLGTIKQIFLHISKTLYYNVLL